MKRRIVSFAVAVWGLFWATSDPTQAQGWAPGGDGVASVQGPYSSTGPGMGSYGGSGVSNWPTTPSYYDAPARYWDDNITRDRGGLYENSPMDKFIEDMMKGAFIRLEYLNWSFKDPGDELLGSETNASLTPSELFDVTLNQQFAGQARVATTTRLKMRNNNGIRGSLGIPLIGGTLEGNIFSFETAADHDLITGLGAPAPGNAIGIPQFIATSTLSGGVVGTNLFLYDSSFRQTMRSDFWGTEANFVLDSYDPRSEFQIRPSFGFRFASSDEDHTQTGVFDQQGQLAIPIESVISSRADNDVYAPQIGTRIEYIHRWFTLGVEPKVGLGWNSYHTGLTVERLRALNDDTVITSASGSRLAITGDLSVYARLHLHQNFSLNVGYQIMFIDNIVRPHDSIYYNDNGPSPAFQADLRTAPTFGLMYWQGINIGGELRF